jgi:predicted transcriptional regulator
MRKAVHIEDNSENIEVLANFTHEEILQLLAEQPMTAAQISKKLILTRQAVGYHLKSLRKANLIYIIKREVEQHGITQKFYSPIANFILPDYDRMSNYAKRYFIQMQIEHLKGVFAALKLHNSFHGISNKMLKKLAEALLKQLKKTCMKYLDKNAVEKTANLKIKIYSETLSNLTKQDEWRNLFK